MENNWTIRRVLEWTRDYLANKGDEKARLSAEWLLCDVCGLSRVELYTNYDRPLLQDELARMHEAVKRRAEGEPLQYVTGEMAFRHLILRCEKGVLIPRPETEVLVDKVLSELEACAPERASRVLDLCTGTACIACSVAQEHPDTVVIATDISPAAARLAERNSRALGLGGWIDVLCCDLAEGVVPEFYKSFDVLVSNPPYIPTEVLKTQIPPEVRDFEPALALDGGTDGLDIFRRILKLAPDMLRSGGLLAVELFEDSLDSAAELATEQGVWSNIQICQDLTERPRILLARLKD